MAWIGKTHKGAAKRFRVIKANKFVHDKSCKSHLLTKQKRATESSAKTGKLLSVTQKKRNQSFTSS